jgi:aminoglycoside 3-N-acetyltransferase
MRSADQNQIQVVTRGQILDGLRRLGVAPGMKLMVHSSLGRFGRVDGGALAVIGALQDAVTARGTILMPSFNHGTVFNEGAAGYYDPLSSPTTNGIIPDTFWRQPGVLRSWNPTHPFACWGHDAERYTRWHHRTLTMGPDSPLGLLARDGGHGLFLGTEYRTNTLHHVAEYMERSPCLGWRSCALPMRLPDGRMVEGRTWAWRSERCPINEPGTYADEMAARGLERRGTIGSATIVLFRLSDCLDLVRELLQTGHHGHPPCRRCPIRPMKSETDVPSDWDPSTGQLRPDSPALRY